MNRWLTQFRYSLEKKVVDLYLKAAIGGTGAPTLDAKNSKGITSIARNSAGNYTVIFNDTAVSLLNIHYTIIQAAGAIPASVVVRSVNTATKTCTIEFLDGTGAAVEIASGAELHVNFEFKDSTV